MNSFPRDLANKVIGRWENLVAGQYVTPPRPTDRLFRQLLEAAYLASAVPDEGRFPRFNIVAVPPKDLRIKYRLHSSVLRRSFIDFMNARHRNADLIEQIEGGQDSLHGDYAISELDLRQKHEQLVEAIRFVAKLSACDGAIVISEDLHLLGFGAEIRSEFKSGTRVEQVIDDLKKVNKALDVESFGLRHRSAIKLVSRRPASSVLVISQDGAVSFVWSEKPKSVYVKRGVNLINMNMPWA